MSKEISVAEYDKILKHLRNHPVFTCECNPRNIIVDTSIAFLRHVSVAWENKHFDEISSGFPVIPLYCSDCLKVDFLAASPLLGEKNDPN